MHCKEIIEAIKGLSNHDIYDWLILIVPAILSLVNVWIVNSNTNKQIKNQNKETYRPRLKLKNIERAQNVDYIHSYYAHSKHFQEEQNKGNIKFKIQLENIGTGLANDIQFYILNSGERCFGYQIGNSYQNQILDSTEELPVNQTLDVYFNIYFNREIIKDKENFLGDYVLLICNYQDLNKNNYKILIEIKVKELEWNSEYDGENELEKVIFDYRYYQENTNRFNKAIGKKRYFNNYKKILKQIKLN